MPAMQNAEASFYPPVAVNTPHHRAGKGFTLATGLVACLMIIGGVTPQTWAAKLQTRVVRRAVHQVYTPVKRRVWVHTGAGVPVTAISSTPQLHTPSRDLVAVSLVNGVTVYINPNSDYIHQGAGRVDANGIIPTAQRLYRSLNAKPARIVTGKHHRPGAAAFRPALIRPHMIMMKPPGLESNPPKPKQHKKSIPTVPGPPKKNHHRLMAMTTNGANH